MGASLDNPLLLALLVLVAIYLAVFMWSRPRAALTLWLVCTVLVPVWPELRIGASLQPLSALAILMLPAVLHHWRDRVRFGDWIMILFAATATIAFAFFNAPQFAWIAVFTQWGAAYLVGRSLGPAAGKEWIFKGVAIAGTFAGVWSIIEFAAGLHVFENYLVGLDSAGWHTIQVRGSLARSEGAFGHSIALGGFLALCVPFVIGCRTTTGKRISMLSAVTLGALVTFSRGAIIGVALAIALSLLFMASETLTRKTRGALITVTVLASLVAVPFTLSLFGSVSDDLTLSTSYRGDLSTSFIPDLHSFGLATGVQFVDGVQHYRQFTSIDNAYALIGMQLGFVPLLVLVAGVIACVIRLLRGRGGPADVAIASQAVVLYTVALITQYGLLVFFVAGLASAFSGGLGSEENRDLARERTEHAPTPGPKEPLARRNLLPSQVTPPGSRDSGL